MGEVVLFFWLVTNFGSTYTVTMFPSTINCFQGAVKMMEVYYNIPGVKATGYACVTASPVQPRRVIPPPSLSGDKLTQLDQKIMLAN